MATSVVKAVIDLYETLTAANFGGAARPPIYLDSAPAVDGSGDQLRVPYVVLHDETGFEPTYTTAPSGSEGGTLRLEVFDTTLALVDAHVLALKYNGSAPNVKAGLDWGTLTLTGYIYHIALKRIKEKRSYAGFNQSGARVHKCDLTYRCVIGLKAS